VRNQWLPYLFNDGEFFFWAVFEILNRRAKPMVARRIGIVRVPVGKATEAAVLARFPGMDFTVRQAWKSQVNRWRRKYPHKTLYKAPYPLNRARCKKCGTVIESMHVHDFVRCRCKLIAVDGGYDYRRRAGPTEAIEEMP
jgi:hypothetical protein